MRRIDAVVYDLEIVRCVPCNGEEREPDLEYCGGWGDRAGMGISVLCAYDMYLGRMHTFLADNLDDFFELITHRQHLIGFNSKQFDDRVVEAVTGRHIETTYDLKDEVFAATGEKRGMSPKGGRTLDELCRVNLGGAKKSEHGGDAPKLWQRGKYGRVINYCMKDVWLTARLVDKLPSIIDPVTGQTLTVKDVPERALDLEQQALL